MKHTSSSRVHFRRVKLTLQTSQLRSEGLDVLEFEGDEKNHLEAGPSEPSIVPSLETFRLTAESLGLRFTGKESYLRQAKEALVPKFKAAVERLTYRAHIIETGSQSHRFKRTLEAQAARKPAPPRSRQEASEAGQVMAADPIGDRSRYGSDGSRDNLLPDLSAAISSSRATFCSAACKQRAWRLRHLSLPNLDGLKRDLRRRRQLTAASVYECPACQMLGERRCPACNLMCRRVGLGAECPHCGAQVGHATSPGRAAPAPVGRCD